MHSRINKIHRFASVTLFYLYRPLHYFWKEPFSTFLPEGARIDPKHEPLCVPQVSTQSVHIWTRWSSQCCQRNGHGALGYVYK